MTLAKERIRRTEVLNLMFGNQPQHASRICESSFGAHVEHSARLDQKQVNGTEARIERPQCPIRSRVTVVLTGGRPLGASRADVHARRRIV